MRTRFFNFIGVMILASSFISAQLFISEAAEGSSNNKYLEFYNSSSETIDLSGYGYPSVSNAPTTDGEYEYWQSFDDGATVAPGDVYVVCHGSSDDFILAECDEYHTYLSNGDDGYCLVSGDETDYTILDCIGDFYGDPGSGWDVCGVSAATKDHTIVRKSLILNGNAGNWDASAGTNADDCEWLVYDQNDWSNLGSHTIDAPQQNIISLGLATETSIEVLFSSDTEIAGFQFNLAGTEITSASGGAADDAGFFFSTNNDLLLAFSLTGGTIPAGDGLLAVSYTHLTLPTILRV